MHLVYILDTETQRSGENYDFVQKIEYYKIFIPLCLCVSVS